MLNKRVTDYENLPEVSRLLTAAASSENPRKRFGGISNLPINMIEHIKSNNTWDEKGKKKRVQEFVDVIMNS
jgi:hypothetical protein